MNQFLAGAMLTGACGRGCQPPAHVARQSCKPDIDKCGSKGKLPTMHASNSYSTLMAVRLQVSSYFRAAEPHGQGSQTAVGRWVAQRVGCAHVEVLMAPAITEHGGAQQAALACLCCDYNSSAAVTKQYTGGCSTSTNVCQCIQSCSCLG